MTKRAVVVTTSIIAVIVLTLTILFGMVFRVSTIDVAYCQNFKYEVQIDEIIKSSKLNKNDSIFAINQKEVISNIEKEYPYARVDGISLGARSVTIKLSNRSPLYYFVENEICYILDEDCKVLEKVSLEEYNRHSYNFVLLNNVFSAGDKVNVGDFLSGEYSKLCNELYKAMYTNATLNIGEDVDADGNPDEKYLDKTDICDVINDAKFVKIYELNQQVNKLTMTTSYGCKISIVDANHNLDSKINKAFSALRALIEYDEKNETTKSTEGTIAVRYSYDDNNNISVVTEYYID